MVHFVSQSLPIIWPWWNIWVQLNCNLQWPWLINGLDGKVGHVLNSHICYKTQTSDYFLCILFLHLEVWWVQNVMRVAIICHSDSQIRSHYSLSPPVQNYGNIKGAHTKCLKQETETSCTTIITWSTSGLVSHYLGYPKKITF